MRAGPGPSTILRAALRAAATTAVVLAAAATADATIVVRATVGEMTDLCRRCVYGTVRSKTVALDERRGAITTTWTVRVDEAWVGENAGEVAVTVPGGKVGTLSQEVAGAARFETGERVVVFLWKDAEGRLQVLGEAQGAFRVTHDERAGEDVCENRTAGLSFVDRARKTAHAAPTRLTLREMRRRVGDAKAARAERERAAREEIDRRLAAMKKRAEEILERTRGRPGSAPE